MHGGERAGQAPMLPLTPQYYMMLFMIIALISVMGSGLAGVIGVLMHYLLKQNAQRAEEHTTVLAAIAEQGIGLRDHADGLHREAMAAIAEQGRPGRRTP